MKYKKIIGLLLTMLYGSVSIAAVISNDIDGVGPNQSVKPYFCIQNKGGQVTYALAPGQSINATLYSGNRYYAGGALRLDGCDVNNTYLGYLGVSANSLNYSAPESVYINIKNLKLSSNGSIKGKLSYLPIQSNFDLLSAKNNNHADWDFVGINLSGLEFSKVLDPVVVPNLSKEDIDSPRSDLVDTEAFIEAGMNTVRVPLRWGYLQLDGPGKGEINLEYYNNFVKPLLETLTNANVHTIVDLHAYMRYSKFGKGFAGCGSDGACPDGDLVLDPKAYRSVWGKLYQLMKSNPNINMDYILFDLVNEPVEVPGDDVFTIQASVIKMLRAQGFKGYILVEGNSWSGLHSWAEKEWTSKDGSKTFTNATLFTRENFLKVGITDLSKILINVHQYFDSNYSGAGNRCLTDLSTEGPGKFNLNAFVDYLAENQMKAIVTEFGFGRDENTCRQALRQFLTYMQDNSSRNKDYGFVGWTIWSTGHGWGDYKLRVLPTDGSFVMNELVSAISLIE